MASKRKQSKSGSDATLSLLGHFEKAVGDIRQLVACKICTRPMFEPYVTSCGHSFCYSCLSHWFDTHSASKTCPNCRENVQEEPVPDFTIRDIVHVLIARPELLEVGDTTEALDRDRTEEASIVERDRANQDEDKGGLFRGCFRRQPLPIYDELDNVVRCPTCHWELEGATCANCGRQYDVGVYLANSSISGDSIGNGPDDRRSLDGDEEEWHAPDRGQGVLDLNVRPHRQVSGEPNGWETPPYGNLEEDNLQFAGPAYHGETHSTSSRDSDDSNSDDDSDSDSDESETDTDLDGFIESDEDDDEADDSSATESNSANYPSSDASDASNSSGEETETQHQHLHRPTSTSHRRPQADQSWPQRVVIPISSSSVSGSQDGDGGIEADRTPHSGHSTTSDASGHNDSDTASFDTDGFLDAQLNAEALAEVPEPAPCYSASRGAGGRGGAKRRRVVIDDSDDEGSHRDDQPCNVQSGSMTELPEHTRAGSRGRAVASRRLALAQDEIGSRPRHSARRHLQLQRLHQVTTVHRTHSRHLISTSPADTATAHCPSLPVTATLNIDDGAVPRSIPGTSSNAC